MSERVAAGSDRRGPPFVQGQQVRVWDADRGGYPDALIESVTATKSRECVYDVSYVHEDFERHGVREIDVIYMVRAWLLLALPASPRPLIHRSGAFSLIRRAPSQQPPVRRSGE